MSKALLEYLAPGTRVSFTYTHHLNSRSTTQITKLGTVVRTIKHRNKLYAQQVAVLFDGNKTESIVQMDSIEIASQGVLTNRENKG